MKIIDKYILKKFLGSFIFTVLIIVSIILVIDITEKTEKFAKAELSTAEVIGYYMDFVPWIANFITPLTVFIATVFVTARMAGHTEIIAILSSGVSFRRMLLPYFIGSMLIAITSFYLTGWVIPDSNKSRVAFEIEYLKSKYYFDKTNYHIQVAPNTYLYMRSYNNQSDMGYDFTLERVEGTRLLEKLSASRIKWDEEKQKWSLTNWKWHSIAGDVERIDEGKEMDTTLAIHPSEFDNDYRSYDAMTINELDEQIAKLRLRGASNVEVFEVEKYVRFTSPFAVLILTFMGVIVSARKTRGGAGFQIALGFLLSFIYILLFIMTKTIAEAGGGIDPAISVWFPNILFGGISLIMYKYVPR
ncbi:membrane protein, putative [Fulvivirga imtechensis AK7]|uniref:Membrane protein, putative n=1 Tax=Fulvivirga imtechensis AK7 TaxID=1237149 RepID=L8JSQ1_9BACT|nr:LptF/LptG family permease [Fulvivirga imtechensis]ELR70519.1 membrane protein, putative [Fulvivirga imtechensis AK7]